MTTKKTKRKKSSLPVRHAKTIIRITPKFVHGVVVGAVVGLFVVAMLRATSSANAASPTNCGLEAVQVAGGKGYFKSFTVSGDTATSTFKVTGSAGCSMAVTIATWQAPYGSTNFQPYSQQKLIAAKTETFTNGTHTMTSPIAKCYYQVDLIRGIAATGPDGSASYVYPQLIDWLQSGSTVCTKPTPAPTPTPTPTPAATTTPTPTPTATTTTATPTALANTGPGAVIIIFILAAIGGFIFHMTHRRIKHKHHAKARR